MPLYIKQWLWLIQIALLGLLLAIISFEVSTTAVRFPYSIHTLDANQYCVHAYFGLAAPRAYKPYMEFVT